ncbi:MAG: DUF2244 domain-containing protein [Gammaproteobacteria bacterium]|nr:DUF2244 domain-containing protein [Gammaproteobacteria bacterium]
MVESDISPENNRATFVIKPNCSLTWKQAKRVFLFLTACLVAVGMYFFQIGAWLVLPFTGLEIGLVGFAIYKQFERASRRQVIEIENDMLWVSNGAKNCNRISFPIAWLQIRLNKGPRSWYPSRLLVGSHGRFVEIGRSLIESEREILAEDLRCAVGK